MSVHRQSTSSTISRSVDLTVRPLALVDLGGRRATAYHTGMKISQVASDPDRAGDRAGRSAGRILVAGAVLCLVASGALMWWRHGPEVFESLVTSTLAWCF